MEKQKVFVLFLVSLFLTSCSTDLLNLDNQIPDVTLEMRAGTVTVSPSGDMTGNLDADAIENALNEPGAKLVILTAGAFYISRSISAPTGFNGVVRGKGKNSTFIIGVGTASDPFDNTLIYGPLLAQPIQGSAFFYFPDPSGSLAISDMSLSIPNGFVAEQSELDYTQNLTMFIGVKLGAKVADVELRNLKLKGADAAAGSYDWHFSQPNFAAVVLGDRDPSDFPQPSNAGGKFKVQYCDISRTSYQALVFEVLKDAQIGISRNNFSETKQINIRFLDGCKVKIEENAFQTILWGSIVVTQELALPPGFGPINGLDNDVRILNNHIVSDGYLGVEIGGVPYPNAASFHVLIEGNTIIMGPAPLGGQNNAGIGLFEGLSGAVIRSNVLKGEAHYGIFFKEVNNSEISQNTTDGFIPYCADYGLIGPSNNNEVITTDAATAVDEGAGNSYSGPVTLVPPCI